MSTRNGADVSQRGDGVLVEILRPNVTHDQIRRQAVDDHADARLDAGALGGFVNQLSTQHDEIAADGASQTAAHPHVNL